MLAKAGSVNRRTRDGCAGMEILQRGNRAWLKTCKGKALLRARGEKVERSFAH